MIHDHTSLIVKSHLISHCYPNAISIYYAGVLMVIFPIDDESTNIRHGCSAAPQAAPAVTGHHGHLWLRCRHDQHLGIRSESDRKCGMTSLTCHPEIGGFLQKNSLKLGIMLENQEILSFITPGRLYISISNSEYKIINISIFISRYIQYFIVNF